MFHDKIQHVLVKTIIFSALFKKKKTERKFIVYKKILKSNKS